MGTSLKSLVGFWWEEQSSLQFQQAKVGNWWTMRLSIFLFLPQLANSTPLFALQQSDLGSFQIGRLPMEWTKCVVPLVNSGKVELNARCVAAPPVLFMMQDIMLYVSFYIHHSIFTDVDMYSWKLNASNIDSTVYPLLTLFRLLKIRPYQNAEFTPEELDSRKRLLNLEVCGATLLFILHFFDIIICIV
ncbi:DNA repair protein RAD5B [Ziziphus jujuba]|uniref:DNA repair protein RAD5B n=1 Tax=Ziziphus jujuba TaxID=326968 RepID=A0ABM3IXC6_ZIZJJ|nr:DNA repair protein RAD5B [Ziziphus jujuba]